MTSKRQSKKLTKTFKYSKILLEAYLDNEKEVLNDY